MEISERATRRGIYLVANKKSQNLSKSLIYSIRATGCQLPIRLLPYGGVPVDCPSVLEDVETLSVDDFPKEGQQFLQLLISKGFNPGLVTRFLAWFGDWDEFIYTDNDVVAMCNWEQLFELFGEHDILNADEEYKTEGRFNYQHPDRISEIFGAAAMESLVTAGHFLSRRGSRYAEGILEAAEWMSAHRETVRWHDQTALHLSILLKGWKVRNLCRDPDKWLSSWAGDYPNTLILAQTLLNSRRMISHIHYSGGEVAFANPMDDLLLAHLSKRERLQQYVQHGVRELVGIQLAKRKYKRLLARLKW